MYVVVERRHVERLSVLGVCDGLRSWRESRGAARYVGIAEDDVSLMPLVTVREKGTGVVRKINLSELDDTVVVVIPDVHPALRMQTKRERDRAISLDVYRREAACVHRHN